jgi:MFS family permease
MGRLGKTGWVVGAGVLVATYDLGALGSALVALRGQWHLSAGDSSLLGVLTLSGMLIAALGAGALSDRFGRRHLLSVDFVLFVVAELASAAAPGAGVEAVARFFVGVAIGAEYAVAFPYLAELLPGHRASRSMAWILWAANFGMLVAYGLGALLVPAFADGWRVLLGLGALGAVPLVALRSRIPESEPWQRSEHHDLGEALRRAWRPEARRSLVASAGSWFAYQAGDQGLSLFLPLLLVGVLGTKGAGLGASVGVKAVTIPAALMTVALIARLGTTRLQLIGFVGRALGLLGAATALALRAPIGVVLASLVVAFFFGAGGPDKTTVIHPALAGETSTRGTGQGLSEAAGRAGGLAGIAAWGLLVPLGGDAAGLAFYGVLAVVGGALTWLGRQAPTAATRPPLTPRAPATARRAEGA